MKSNKELLETIPAPNYAALTILDRCEYTQIRGIIESQVMISRTQAALSQAYLELDQLNPIRNVPFGVAAKLSILMHDQLFDALLYDIAKGGDEAVNTFKTKLLAIINKEEPVQQPQTNG